MKWYYSFLVRRPYLMVLAIGVLCTACIIVSLITKSFPDFSNPTLGFEARGTKIGQRLTAWRNLWHETGPSGKLVSNPSDLQYFQNEFNHNDGSRGFHKKHQRKKKKNKKKFNVEFSRKMKTLRQFAMTDADANPTEWNGATGIFRDYAVTNETEVEPKHQHFSYGKNMSFVDEDDQKERLNTKKSTWHILTQSTPPPMYNTPIHIDIDGYFCDAPNKEYSHFVVERIGPNSTDSLFDVNSMLAMCQLEQQITGVPGYSDYCQKEMLTDNCCRPWSIANFVGLLTNKTSCFDLTHEDVATVQSLLVACHEYYINLKLSNDCSKVRCYAPPECMRHNAVFNILHFLTDLNFIKVNDSNLFLKYAMIFVPVAQTTKILPLFHQWEKISYRRTFHGPPNEKLVRPTYPTPIVPQVDPYLVPGHAVNNILVNKVPNESKTWTNPNITIKPEEYVDYVEKMKKSNPNLYNMHFDKPDINVPLLDKVLADRKLTTYQSSYSPNVFVPLLQISKVRRSNLDTSKMQRYDTTYKNQFSRIGEYGLVSECSFTKRPPDSPEMGYMKYVARPPKTTYYANICFPACLKRITLVNEGRLRESPCDEFTLRRI